LKHQESNILVCDQEFFELKPPQNKIDEYREYVGSVNKIVIGGSKVG
jgi:hypothetical protein